MKKVVLNISETTYEKLRFEAISEKKSINELLADRIFYKPFSKEIEKKFEELMESEINKIMECK